MATVDFSCCPPQNHLEEHSDLSFGAEKEGGMVAVRNGERVLSGGIVNACAISVVKVFDTFQPWRSCLLRRPIFRSVSGVFFSLFFLVFLSQQRSLGLFSSLIDHSATARLTMRQGGSAYLRLQLR